MMEESFHQKRTLPKSAVHKGEVAYQPCKCKNREYSCEKKEELYRAHHHSALALQSEKAHADYVVGAPRSDKSGGPADCQTQYLGIFMVTR